MDIDLCKLKIMMAKECLSANELAEKSELGRSTISKIINGKQKPSTKSLGLIAKALRADVTELVVKGQ